MNYVNAVMMLFAVGLPLASAVADPMEEDTFHTRVIALYSFHPHDLNEQQMEAKSGDLDKFWDMIKAEPHRYLPLLRRELNNPSNPSFFFYDGSRLLMTVSKDHADEQLALDSLPKVDFKDIDRSDYLIAVHWLAAQGLDTRNAAFRILDDPGFKAFIPQHALTLGQNYSLIYMLFPLNESTFTDDLIRQLATANEAVSQKTLLLALRYVVLARADTAIRTFAEDASRPQDSRDYARQLLTISAPAIAKRSDDALREQRRKTMSRPISDEALEEFDYLTHKLLGDTTATPPVSHH